MPVLIPVPLKTPEEIKAINDFFLPILNSQLTIVESKPHHGRILLGSQIALQFGVDRTVLFHSKYIYPDVLKHVVGSSGWMMDLARGIDRIIVTDKITETIDLIRHDVLMIDTESVACTKYLVQAIIFALRMGLPVVLFVESLTEWKGNERFAWYHALQPNQELGRRITYRLIKENEESEWTPIGPQNDKLSFNEIVADFEWWKDR